MAPHPDLTFLDPAAGGMVPARLTLRDGVKLALRTYAPKGPVRGSVLVTHGAGMHSEYYVALGRMFAAKGYFCALMDTRGHGASEGARGDVDARDTYRLDMKEAVLALAPMGRVVLVSHSGSAAVATDLLSQSDAPDLAGFAMMTPTFADDGALVRRSTGGRDLGGFFRYQLSCAPERVIEQTGEGNRFHFRLGRFLIGRLTGLARGLRPLTYFPSRPGEDPYSYTTRALTASMIGDVDGKLRRLEVPVFLATGAQDAFVNSEAVATRLPWVINPAYPVRHVHQTRGDHFSTLLLSLPGLLEWMEPLCPVQTAQQEVAA